MTKETHVLFVCLYGRDRSATARMNQLVPECGDVTVTACNPQGPSSTDIP